MPSIPSTSTREDLLRVLRSLPCPLLLQVEGSEEVWCNRAMLQALGLDAGAGRGLTVDRLPLRDIAPAPRHGVLYRRSNCRSDSGLRASVRVISSDRGALRIASFEPVDRRRSNVVPLFGAGSRPSLGRRTPGGVDPATGLPNRASIGQVLDSEVSRSRRYANPLSVLLVSLDARSVPDPYRIMVEIGRNLQEQTRWADNIGRFDTYQFLVVLPETGAGAARALVAKLRDRLDGLPYGHAVGFAAAEWKKGDDAALLIGAARSVPVSGVSELKPV